MFDTFLSNTMLGRREESLGKTMNVCNVYFLKSFITQSCENENNTTDIGQQGDMQANKRIIELDLPQEGTLHADHYEVEVQDITFVTIP